MPRDSADRDLVADAKNGVSAAWERIVARHSRRLFGIVRKWFPCGHDAEDLVSEVWRRALGAIGGLRPGSNLGPWLGRIAVNLARDEARKRKRRSSEEATDAVPAPNANPAEEAVRQETRRRVRHAVARLPEHQRRIVGLRMAGVTSSEIQSILGISAAAFHAAVYRAHRALREALSAESVPFRP